MRRPVGSEGVKSLPPRIAARALTPDASSLMRRVPPRLDVLKLVRRDARFLRHVRQWHPAILQNPERIPACIQPCVRPAILGIYLVSIRYQPLFNLVLMVRFFPQWNHTG